MNYFQTHASLYGTLQWFLNGGRFFPPKTTFGSHIGKTPVVINTSRLQHDGRPYWTFVLLPVYRTI